MRRGSTRCGSSKDRTHEFRRDGAVTTTFFLVRHAAHERLGGLLCGRMPGVSLGSLGQGQAKRLGQRFANENIASVQTSPLERARETAQPIAAATGREPEICEGIVE